MTLYLSFATSLADKNMYFYCRIPINTSSRFITQSVWLFACVFLPQNSKRT